MKRSHLLMLAPALIVAGYAIAQYPIMDMVADDVVKKYQSASCEQLWMKKGEPKTAKQQEMIQMLRGDPQARTYFINKVAGPIVNKMFECGMIP